MLQGAKFGQSWYGVQLSDWLSGGALTIIAPSYRHELSRREDKKLEGPSNDIPELPIPVAARRGSCWGRKDMRGGGGSAVSYWSSFYLRHPIVGRPERGVCVCGGECVPLGSRFLLFPAPSLSPVCQVW